MTTSTSIPVTFSGATATYYQTYYGDWLPSQIIDGITNGAQTGNNPPANGWAIYQNNGQSDQTYTETALLTLASPLAAGPHDWTITLYQNYGGALLGDFSLGYSTDATPTLSSTDTPFTITGASSLDGATFTLLGDGQLLAGGPPPGVTTDVYTITLTENSPLPITGLFLTVINDPSNGLPTGGPGRFPDGNFVITELTAEVSTVAPTPSMFDVIKNTNNGLTTLSGMSEANSVVSIFDGTKLLGTATTDNFGNWSLQAKITGSAVHQFTETATDLAGNTGSSAGVTLYSPGTNDKLVGANGNDFLIAGPKDTLTGGAGNDAFVFNANFGKVAVSDFDITHDVLWLSNALFGHDTITQVLSQTHDTTAGAVIAVDGHDTITLQGVTVAQLAAHPSDFHFF